MPGKSGNQRAAKRGQQNSSNMGPQNKKRNTSRDVPKDSEDDKENDDLPVQQNHIRMQEAVVQTSRQQPSKGYRSIANKKKDKDEEKDNSEGEEDDDNLNRNKSQKKDQEDDDNSQQSTDTKSTLSSKGTKGNSHVQKNDALLIGGNLARKNSSITKSAGTSGRSSTVSSKTSGSGPSGRMITVYTQEDFYSQGVALGNEKKQLATVKNEIREKLFQHCKILHTNKELDSIDEGSFGKIVMKQCNIHPDLQLGFWATVKHEAKKWLQSLRQQVNTKLKGAFMEHQHKEGSYSLDHIMKHGRKDKKAYLWFVNTYLRCATVRGKENGLLHYAPSQVFTICDEVMVIWFLENSWDLWMDMKAKNITKPKESEVLTKYTVPGDKAGKGKDRAGWTVEGKARYNALFDMIQLERKSVAGKEFDSYYVNDVNKPKTAKQTKVKKSIVGQDMVAKNTLSMLVDLDQEMSPLHSAKPYEYDD